MFLDSDDLINAEQLTNLTKKIASNIDLYIFNIYSNSQKRIKRYQYYLMNSYRGNIDFLSLLLFWTPPWGKLISRNFLKSHGLEFECVRYSNDVLFSTKLALTNPRVGIELSKIYFVRSHAKSLTKTTGLDSFRIRLNEEIKRYDLLVKSGYSGNAPFLLTWLVRSTVYGPSEICRTLRIIRFNRLDIYRTGWHYIRRALSALVGNTIE